MEIEDFCFPPPWNILENPEKTLGWIEFQKQLKENDEYRKYFWNLGRKKILYETA